MNEWWVDVNRSINFDEALTFPVRENDIFAVGELLVDMMSEMYDDNITNTSYRKLFGGSPSNIAMNATSLGIHANIASAVGEDAFGTFLVDKLQIAGIDTGCVQRNDYSTSMVVVTKSRSTPIPIFYRGADYQLMYTKVIEEALLNSKIVHFSCWPISMAPARQTIEKMIAIAKENQILIGFDPNYHPLIWQRGEEGLQYIKSMLKNVDIVKPSEVDAERLFGKDTYENQIEKFLELGVKLVIMTLGKDGAIVSNGQNTLRFDSLASEVVDTTGAGDAFWSGFYTAIVQGYTVKEALSLGFAVSAYKLQHTGAVIELPRLEVIKQLYSL